MVMISRFHPVVGLLLCTPFLTAGMISSSCTVQYGPPSTSLSYSPCSSFNVTVPPGSSITGFVSGTDQTAEINLNAGISGLDLDILIGQASYSAGTTYIVPGLGTGTIQATVYAGGRGGSVPAGAPDNSLFGTTLGSSSYSCRPSQPGPPFPICGMRIEPPVPPIHIVSGILVTDYAQTGTFTLGQPFMVGFSLSDYVIVNLGERAAQFAAGGITSLQFFDAAGHPVTPTEAPVPEPMMFIPVGIALVLLKRFRL
jgi:hypothetical protein